MVSVKEMAWPAALPQRSASSYSLRSNAGEGTTPGMKWPVMVSVKRTPTAISSS